MATTPATDPAPKRARVPYRPPLLSLWARNDLADNVVACLSPSNIPKLPVVAKAFRAAQPLVLFTAARRLGVGALATTNFISALRTASPERFRETWTEGLERWRMDPRARHPASQLEATVVGSSPHHVPHLRLVRGAAHGFDSEGPSATNYHHGGLYRLFRPSAASWGVVPRRFHTRVCFPNGLTGPYAGVVGYVILSGDTNYPHETARDATVIGGLRGTPRVGGLYNTPTLLWSSNTMVTESVGSPEVPRSVNTELCPVAAGVWCDVEATFSNADDDEGYMTATVVVSFSGQRITHSIRCLAQPLAVVKVYNFGDGTALVGDIELDYNEEPLCPTPWYSSIS